MTYQAAIIKQFIQASLEKMGVFLDNAFVLEEMIAKNIRRLNVGDKIAVDFDAEGKLKSVRRIDGFDCLHGLGEGALIVSYAELERYFYEQQSISVEFSE
jgi:hypothetical protein